MHIIATRGISNSGKTTWAEQWLAAAPNRARINRDAIREQIFGGSTHGDQAKEDQVTKVYDYLFAEFLSEGRDVVSDNMHLHQNSLYDCLALARKVGAQFSIKVFDVDLDEALERNRKRGAAGGLFVPEEHILSMHERYHQRPLPADLLPFVIS